MKKLLLLFCLTFFLAACEQEQQSGGSMQAPTTEEATPFMRAAINEFNEEGEEETNLTGESFIPVPNRSKPSEKVVDRSKLAKRRVAETHTLNIEILHDNLAPRYDRDFQKCLDLGCEIQNSNMSNRLNGYILARVPPKNLGTYLDFLTIGNGELKSHAVNTQDKTLSYLDTEARLKSQEELRERLKSLLQKADTVDNIIRIETELARVEKELDSAVNSLRHLKNITGMATVRVNYSVPYQDIQVQYDDLKNSFTRAWQEFIENIANVITFIGAVLPWLPVVIGGLWLLLTTIRFAFRKKQNVPKKKTFKKDKQGSVDNLK